MISLLPVRHKKNLSHLIISALAIPRALKMFIVLTVDIILCVITVWLSYYFRLGEFVGFTSQTEWVSGIRFVSLLSITCAIPIFLISGFYRAIFRYIDWRGFLVILKALGFYAVIFAGILIIGGIQGVPRTIGFIQPLLLLFFLGASRVLISFLLSKTYREQLQLNKLPKVLIYGAGQAGRGLELAIVSSKKMQVIGFVDDNSNLHGRTLNTLCVYQPEKIDMLIDRYKINKILLAIPSLRSVRRAQILNNLSKFNVIVHTLPSLQDLVGGKISISDIRDLDIEDLLERDEVAPDIQLMSKNIKDKVVLVTGAGGSIGGELSRQIIRLNPKKIILFEQNEFSLYEIELAVKKQASISNNTGYRIIPILGSVCDKNLVRKILEEFTPHVIFHAAAYKHVSLVENNPVAGILNNLFGTRIIAKLAAQLKVPNFILISTDKAVRPANIMGASKRLAEMVVQALANNSKSTNDTIFSMVRFGNVINSSGSVIPLFRRQIKDGGPVTVTHLEATRFFMTIPEAAQLVLQASSMAIGGDVFVLDMGEPVKIIDLAKKMIRLSGLHVKDEFHKYGDIEIKVTGLRTGEKLYEELLINNNPTPTIHKSIFKANEDFLPIGDLEVILSNFERQLPQLKIEEIRSFLKGILHDYSPTYSCSIPLD